MASTGLCRYDVEIRVIFTVVGKQTDADWRVGLDVPGDRRGKDRNYSFSLIPQVKAEELSTENTTRTNALQGLPKLGKTSHRPS
ncbi:hypothetical protein [Yoonia sediminilitoris]|uniref:Uncharacterized protein n=1 Tax=Yoonia sediminilitoris TaxID=1286148 RepID=A0A2T6KPN0_9RHOB|nr:hypothetical protein [Yoonia sediminilitoris]PUB18524.1 hypothetical protein C8N45_101108 [Yoonia sediminilitoris]RCW98692.1 hypothetical protein DFP92_101108 [Yoonia sediminilitoris]